MSEQQQGGEGAAPDQRQPWHTTPAGDAPVFMAGASATTLMISAALARAQGAMFSPPRNKTATVQPKDRSKPSYTYSYSSLDVILEMLRVPLFDNGLEIHNVVRPGRGGDSLWLHTYLAHNSGEWFESVWPIAAAGLREMESIQRLGANMSYAQRYNIRALLNVASEEDTDAAESSEGVIAPPSGEAADIQAGQVAGERYRELIIACNRAQKPADAATVLRLWAEHYQQWVGYRDDPKKESEWTTVVGLVSTAIMRAHGSMLADYFTRLHAARTSADLDGLSTEWTVALVQARRSMKEANEVGYNILAHQGHMRRGEIAKAEQLAARQAEILAARAAAAAVPEPEGAPVAFVLFDEVGDALTEPMDDAVRWYRDYLVLWGQSTEHEDLIRHNRVALDSWALSPRPQPVEVLALPAPEEAPPEEPPLIEPEPEEVPAYGDMARLIASMDDPPAELGPEPPPPAAAPEEPPGEVDAAPALFERPAEELMRPVAVPVSAAGKLNLSGYRLSIERMLGDLATEPDLQAWVDLQRPIITTLPSATKLAVVGMIAKRAKALGAVVTM